MPGLSFIYDINKDLKEKEAEILFSLNSLLHFEHYEANIILKNKSYFLCSTTYEGYPIASFENDNYIIYLEGKIYNHHYSVKKELNTLAELIIENMTYKKERIAEWLLNNDGDFVVFILHKKTNEITIINDALGRLPLYYSIADGRLLISRELRFIANLLNNVSFDRMAIAQTLLFGYPLGKRTLCNNIHRLEPSSLININLNNSRIDIQIIHQFCFDEKSYRQKTLKENVHALVALFSEACKNRADTFNDYKNILSLSGGLDSRSVAAGLYRSNIPFYGATYLDSNRNAIRDAELAKQIANIFKIYWKLFELSPPKGKDVLKLLRMKSGLNYLGMSFILSFFDCIKDAYGPRITYFTGDVGSVLRDLRPSRKINDIDELLKNILLNNQIYSLDDVSAMTRIPKNEVIDELKKNILSYPERKWDQKYVHFLIYEQCLKWCFEGEDRNRFYFWSVAPLLSIPFFNFVMNCPDHLKSKNTLYREFLLELCPQVCRINNADWNLPIISKRLPIKLYLKSVFPIQYRKIIKQYLFKNPYPYENMSNIMNCIKEQFKNSQSISDYLSCAAVDNIMKSSTKSQIYNLFTITSIIEDIQCNHSTIEKYFEIEFV